MNVTLFVHLKITKKMENQKFILIICQMVMLLLLSIQRIVNIGSTLQHRFILQIKTSV